MVVALAAAPLPLLLFFFCLKLLWRVLNTLSLVFCYVRVFLYIYECAFVCVGGVFIVNVYTCVCICVLVSERERERERESERVRVRERERERV